MGPLVDWPSRAADKESYMIAPPLETTVERLRDLVARSNSILPFHWRRHLDRMRDSDFSFARRTLDEEPTDTIRSFLCRVRRCVTKRWRRRFAMEDHFPPRVRGRGTSPRSQHFYRSEKPQESSRRNIDNRASGSGIPHDHVIELHGNTTLRHLASMFATL